MPAIASDPASSKAEPGRVLPALAATLRVDSIRSDDGQGHAHLVGGSQALGAQPRQQHVQQTMNGPHDESDDEERFHHPLWPTWGQAHRKEK